jgi:hypothetical protein
MIQSASRNRLLGFALLAMSALSLIATIVFVADYAATPNARWIVMASLGCTFFFLATGVLVGLSNLLQNVKR